MSRYTFNKEKRYMTRGIKDRIPLDIMILMWGFVDELVSSTTPTDYLQVFTFDLESDEIVMKQFQEQPEYSRVYRFKYDKRYDELIGLKVYIIDDVTHATALLANEY